MNDAQRTRAFTGWLTRMPLVAALLVGTLLAATPTATARAQEAAACLACHRALVAKASSHVIARMGMCQTCHQPDTTDSAATATRPHRGYALRAQGADLCKTCHAALADTSAQTHMPARMGMCLSCHDPHGSASPHLAKSPMPDLCYTCHPAIRAVASGAVVPHRAVYVDASCANCHSPHRSESPHLLRGRTDSLCLGCHDREYDSPRGRIGNVAQTMRTARFGHFPAQAGMCQACHAPHGGVRPRLLTGEYPIEPYREFRAGAFALCGTCHAVSTLAAAESDSTRFRQGRRNLHAVHLREPGRNRTCFVCHDPHAADNAHKVRAAVPFGAWMLPIGFRATESGGTCASACHEPRAYDRTVPVDSTGAATRVPPP
jgi:predicted CXXCH cytochrome family protein